MSGFRTWMKRGVVAGAAGATVFDLSSDNVLSRSIRTVVNAGRVAAMYKFTTPEKLEDITDMNKKAATILLDTCMINEGLYIKLGQSISSLNHILPPEISKIMSACLDNAPTVGLDQVRQVIQEEMGGKTVEEVFESFDEKPIASASIAQVHRAVWKNPQTGEKVNVAVKVQKPAIARQIWWDLTTHDFVCWALEKTFNMPATWACETINAALEREINFLIEADNLRRAEKIFATRSQNDIVVPRVFTATKRVMISEWMEATKLSEAKKVGAKYDTKAMMQTMTETFGDMIFEHGFVHCDPHPANVLVRPMPGEKDLETEGGKNKRKLAPQLVLLDFGLCTEESDTFRKEFADLFIGLYEHDFKKVEDLIASWGVRHTDLFASMLMQRPYSKQNPNVGNNAGGEKKTMTREEVLAFQQAMKEKSRDLIADDKKVPRELILVGRAMNLLRSNNKAYKSPVNRINLLATRAFNAKYGSTKGFKNMSEDDLLSPAGAPAAVQSWSGWSRALFTTSIVSIAFSMISLYVFLTSMVWGAPELPESANPEDMEAEKMRRRNGDGAGSDGGVESLEDLLEKRETAMFHQHFHTQQMMNVSARD